MASTQTSSWMTFGKGGLQAAGPEASVKCIEFVSSNTTPGAIVVTMSIGSVHESATERNVSRWSINWRS